MRSIFHWRMTTSNLHSTLTVAAFWCRIRASSYSSIVQRTHYFPVCRTHANDAERRVYVTFEASNATVVYRLRFRSCTLRSSVCIFVRYVLGAAAAVTSAVADVLLIAVLLCHPALVTSFTDLSLGNRSSLINWCAAGINSNAALLNLCFVYSVCVRILYAFSACWIVVYDRSSFGLYLISYA